MRAFSVGDDRGATSADYLGTLVVIAAIIGALSGTEIGGKVFEGIQVAICRIAGGGDCAGGGPQDEAGADDAPRTDKDFEPQLCNTANSEDKAGSEIKIGWFTLGNEYGFQQKEFRTPDGETRVYLTFTDAASVGAKGSKPGLKIGKLGTEKVELAGGIKVTNGDTWIFDSPEDAESFRDDLEELKAWEYSMKYGGGMGGPNIYGSYKWAEKHEEIERKLGQQHISFGRIGLEGSADLALKKAKVDEGALSAELGGKFRIAPEATVTNNNASKPPTRSYTYQFQLEYAAGAKIGAGPAETKLEGGQVRTGTMTVTRYEDGSLARVDMTQSVETKGSDSGKITVGGGDNKGSAQGSEKDRTIETTTNSLVFPPGDGPGGATKADRDVAESWLDGNGDNTAPFTYLFGDQAPTKQPGADDPFGRLMYDKGVSSRTEHTGITDAQEYGFEVNLGLSLGAKVVLESSEQRLESAEFLGAPKPDGTRSYLPYSYCAN